MKLLRQALWIPMVALLGFSPGYSQDRAVTDSLLGMLSRSAKDTSRLDLLIELGEQYRFNLPDSALVYYTEALDLAIQLDNKQYMAHSRRLLGIVRESQGAYEKAAEEYFAAIAIFEETGNQRGIAATYNSIGILHYLQESYDQCMDYLTRSYEIKKELGDTAAMANYFINMSALHNSLGNYEEALAFSLESIDLHEELGDKNGIATGYGNIGTIQFELKNYQAALKNHLQSVEIHEEIDNKDGLVHSLSNIAGVYMVMADSLELTESQRLEYINLAVTYGLRCYNLAVELNAVYVENYAANTLHIAYKALNKPWKALEFAEIYMVTRDSLFNEEKTRAIEEMDTKYETEKKQQQIELQESQIIARDATIKQQKTLRNALIVGLLLVLLTILVMIYAYVQKRRDNRKISEQNAQILDANEELTVLNEAISDQNAQILEANEELTVLNEAISKQKNEIVDSINYAQRIQSAMLPPVTYFKELLDEAFILYRPRDIVSGDFFWIKQVNQYIILSAADCTGHGVPGAFMSMLGISFLNEIVQRREITQADQVLNELRYQIKQSLRQHGQPDESRDGIDMALCVIDQKNRTMQYAGAFNPLYLIRETNGEAGIIEFKADRMPLGYYPGKDRPFTNHDITLEIGDTFYLFSDGYIDQKGGPDNKKYMSKRFKNLLLEIHEQPMFEQRNILENTLETWMGDQSQIDDILVVGVRV